MYKISLEICSIEPLQNALIRVVIKRKQEKLNDSKNQHIQKIFPILKAVSD